MLEQAILMIFYFLAAVGIVLLCIVLGLVFLAAIGIALGDK